jgi:anti-sigma factor ChrR (cupin superfamily)
MNGHPSEADLALLAGGDCGWVERLRLKNHVSACGDCQDAMASFAEIRTSLREMALPAVAVDDGNWERLAVEMRANIRLGLAAGECVASGPM